MKLSKAKIQECVEWVENHGLYPQAHGASIKDFIAAMDIRSKDTYYRWCDISDFSDALTRAREVFRQRKKGKYEDSLEDAATGGIHPKRKKIYRINKKGEQVLSQIIEEDVYYPPNVEALKFGLKNLDPEHWKDKQDSDINLDVNNEEPPVIVFKTPAEEAGNNGYE